ncbi:hypothetical protein J2X46_003541 [Nocardioides sp. BE266]|uniref:hypothetical protein n=1 Tax=Nocardioides sp. BE266 TaxID=2817725 RepID=UPI002860DD26|nr:hypothetical protein [Nocardioides sp. BE266]MDR7254548.1 hypothetical protein [Nocardioides sp. BE266]
MNTILALLALTALFTVLVSYVRHDRFAGPSATTHRFDDLGDVDLRQHLVPRA